ncbi:tel Two Interacting protein 2 [Schizosaccharomyces japonicus yFS275]|uniref:Tel Two Interacting protein 2 n=1 Tax=Schizosaccharomyces japonicus (strain yFS275 / FY16936) TaxID=402676 RepID=B6JWS2_SCHJY|nr:tel Two Interacting protein 2 [Schizosaccharomyces japonicus yFS275]EEB05823.2 tel Two Interacting protein 2 [Schizosaccharomyces japonicus yFS275]
MSIILELDQKQDLSAVITQLDDFQRRGITEEVLKKQCSLLDSEKQQIQHADFGNLTKLRKYLTNDLVTILKKDNSKLLQLFQERAARIFHLLEKTGLRPNQLNHILPLLFDIACYDSCPFTVASSAARKLLTTIFNGCQKDVLSLYILENIYPKYFASNERLTNSGRKYEYELPPARLQIQNSKELFTSSWKDIYPLLPYSIIWVIQSMNAYSVEKEDMSKQVLQRAFLVLNKLLKEEQLDCLLTQSIFPLFTYANNYPGILHQACSQIVDVFIKMDDRALVFLTPFIDSVSFVLSDPRISDANDSFLGILDSLIQVLRMFPQRIGTHHTKLLRMWILCNNHLSTDISQTARIESQNRLNSLLDLILQNLDDTFAADIKLISEFLPEKYRRS